MTLMTDLILCNSILVTLNVLNFTEIISNYKKSLLQHGSQMHTKLNLHCGLFSSGVNVVTID